MIVFRNHDRPPTEATARRARWLLPVGWAWAILASATVASAAPVTETRRLITDVGQKLTVEARGWFGLGLLPPVCANGLVPLEFTVSNGGSDEAVIDIRCTTGYGTIATVPRTRIVAPPGGTVRSTVYLGTGRAETALVGYISSPMLTINPSPGFGSRREIVCQIFQTTHSAASPPTPAGVVPSTAAGDSLRRVVSPGAAKRIFAVRQTPPDDSRQSEADPAASPEDWRGWSSLREVVLTDDDWTTLPAASRRAMLEWIALGGHVILLVAGADGAALDRLGLPAPGADGHRRVGAGEIIPLPDGAIPVPAADDPSADDFAGAVERPAGWLDQPWSAGQLARIGGFGERGLPVAAILVFLGILATVAGPLNVAFFAGRGRPSRIFWTTPLISLIATAFLLGLMFLRDGVGGAGIRRTLVLLDPERHSMAVLQEQFSRTGILLGRSFPIREPSSMIPQPIDAFSPSVITGGLTQGAGSFVEVDDQRRTGDWFSSRADQAFTLQTVRPGRGGIELLGPTDTPEVISSLDVPLARLFLRDDEGRWWKTGPLDAGERRRLEPAAADECAAVRRKVSDGASPAIARACSRLGEAPGYAWAEAAAPRKVAVATLDAIRWTEDVAWFVGPVVRTEGR